jgi:hypothetical protein
VIPNWINPKKSMPRHIHFYKLKAKNKSKKQNPWKSGERNNLRYWEKKTNSNDGGFVVINHRGQKKNGTILFKS